MPLPRTLAALLAAAALLAPAAQAKPVDMRSSVAEAAARERQLPKQDLRMPDTRDAATPRSDAQPRTPLLGPPTWPVEPQPLPAPSSAAASDGDGTDWATIAIGVALSVLAVGAIAGVSQRGRVRRRARIAA